MFGKEKQKRQNRIKNWYGKNPLNDVRVERCRERMDKIAIYYDEIKELLEHENVDDITWNDLEMEEVFLRINQTKCYIGEQVLYRRLHELDMGRDWKCYEKQQSYYKEHESERLLLEEKLSDIGKEEEAYYLPMFLMHAGNWSVGSSLLYHFLQLMLLLFFALSIITKQAIFIMATVAVVIVNLMIYLGVKQKYEAYIYSLGSVGQLLSFCRFLLGKSEWKALFGTDKIEEAVESLKKLSGTIKSFQKRKYASWAGDISGMLWDYLYGATLFDISMFNHIMKQIEGKQDLLMELYEFAGEIDMGISVASFRESMKKNCKPEFWEKHGINGKGIYHPLIENAVCNDFSMDGQVLVTGANASGKSTFLKALSINIILAQTIHTCSAEELYLPKMTVMSSMALRDDIVSGESYYIREVKYLKRMLDKVEGGMTVFCVIDEILKGTNTRERLAASEAILHYFKAKNCFVIVATHDMELVEKLRGEYDCYYFESQILGDDIFFDYTIHPGFGGKSNAINLLSAFHFPKNIVTMATELLKATPRRLDK